MYLGEKKGTQLRIPFKIFYLVTFHKERGFTKSVSYKFTKLLFTFASCYYI